MSEERGMRMRVIRSNVFVLLSLLFVVSGFAAPVVLEKDNSGNWRMLVDGKPFSIRGVGRFDQPQLARQCGVNTLRTYSSAKIETVLREMDEAQKNGFKVIRGIWLQRESRNFSYKNPEHIQRQRNSVRAQVRALRHHPVLLCWGLGNESEGSRTKELRPEYWKELNVLAGIVKEEDPDHPVMNVIAGNPVWKIKAVKELAPEIDILGINTYGGAGITAERLDEAGWQKPWILTEFGPRGHWEVPKTGWDVPVEPGSRAKADNYERGFRAAVADAKRCLGMVAFVWSNKQEITGTWYGMFLETGE